jgi:ABC-type transport system substrate-binding protein
MCLALALLSAACTDGGRPAPTPSGSATRSGRGGILRVGLVNDPPCWLSFCGPEAFDPQMTGFIPEVFELFRCCLVRTLLSFSGQPTAEGGALPEPDLAAAPPRVSGDGMTWTFRLKPGLRYAPPLAGTTIVARDFVRSIERLLSPLPPFVPEPWGPILGSYSGGFLDLADIVAGARDYVDGKASTISGLEAPDARTLVVRLTRPTGDLPFRLAQPDFGPIPGNPARPSARFGVADGLARLYGSFFVATGPYMIQGAEKVEPDL